MSETTDEKAELVARLRRMSDMTSTDNDLRDISRAADAIDALRADLKYHLSA